MVVRGECGQRALEVPVGHARLQRNCAIETGVRRGHPATLAAEHAKQDEGLTMRRPTLHQALEPGARLFRAADFHQTCSEAKPSVERARIEHQGATKGLYGGCP